MNDSQLDNLLNQWEPPQPSPSLRQALSRECAARCTPPAPRWHFFSAYRAALAGSALGLGAFLCIAIIATPQTFSPSAVPYTVESRCILYNPPQKQGFFNGPRQEMIMYSFSRKGREVLLSGSSPGHPLENLILHIGFTISSRFGGLLGMTPPEKSASFSAGFTQWFIGRSEELLNRGCAIGTVVGKPTMLGYKTVAVQINFPEHRMNMWLAPDLGCFAMKLKLEDLQPDGTYVLRNEKEALKVTHNQ